MLAPAVLELLSQSIHQPLTLRNFSPISGGSINETFRVQMQHGERYFCKINSATKFPHLFQKERQGLEFIAQKQIIKTPAVILCAEINDLQVLVLEWLEPGEKTKAFWKTFGQQLAALHAVNNKDFGWPEDNYMGSIVQRNNWEQDWCSFFANQRIRPLVHACVQKNLLNEKHVHQVEHLLQRLPQFFAPEPAALMHGDLWSGNFLCSQQQPALIDPAVYFGHRSVDLAMTALFGSFDVAFYEAYHYYFPFPYNYKEQWVICNMYPLLIHLLLFGSAYRSQIEVTLRSFA